MAPFEALYGRKRRTPLNWVEPDERRYFGIDFVTKVERAGAHHPTAYESNSVKTKELC